jgi:hypothetical protein
MKELIRSTRSWHKEGPRRDCILIQKDNSPGFKGLRVARVLVFFGFTHERVHHSCALVTLYAPPDGVVGPCEDTHMWIVEPQRDEDGEERIEVISTDIILRGAHLLPVYGDFMIPREVDHTNSLDLFNLYYVNKFVDHHSHEVVF